MSRRWSAALAVAALVVGIGRDAGAAAPDPAASACIDAAEEAQSARDAGRLLAAREALAHCINDGCPSVVRRDCVKWLDDTTARIPAVRVRAHGKSGEDLENVSVTIDGKAFPPRFEGRFVDVDPGPHLFRFTRPGSAPVERRVVIAERDRSAVVDVELVTEGDRGHERPAPSPEGKGPPLTSILLAGVGVVGIAGFTVFGLRANAGYDDLESRCSPRCTDAQVSPVRTDMLVANISLGVGVVALTAGLVWWLLAPTPRRR